MATYTLNVAWKTGSPPDTFTVRAQTKRRFLVVDINTRKVVKRTDDAVTAFRVQRQDAPRRVVLNTVTGELI